jgi:hypothetical protein
VELTLTGHNGDFTCQVSGCARPVGWLLCASRGFVQYCREHAETAPEYLAWQRRMERAKEMISVGKISGAVGTFAHIPPSVETYVCERLGLKPAPISTQIVQRDHHAEYATTLAFWPPPSRSFPWS